jgi:uncharacterized membrane protein YjjP (DUF1212 family)
MPIPVLAGLPWLAGVISGLLTSLIGFLAQFISKRLSIVLIAITTLTALTTAFAAAITALVSGISAATPEYFSIAASWIVPSNTVACLSACVSGRFIRWVYEWNVRIVMMKVPN